MCWRLFPALGEIPVNHIGVAWSPRRPQRVILLHRHRSSSWPHEPARSEQVGLEGLTNETDYLLTPSALNSISLCTSKPTWSYSGTSSVILASPLASASDLLDPYSWIRVSAHGGLTLSSAPPTIYRYCFPCLLPVLGEDAVTSGKYNRHFQLKTVKVYMPATFYKQLSYFQGKFQLLWWIGKHPVQLPNMAGTSNFRMGQLCKPLIAGLSFHMWCTWDTSPHEMKWILESGKPKRLMGPWHATCVSSVGTL